MSKKDIKGKLDSVLGQIDKQTLGEGKYERQRAIIQERRELRPVGRPTKKKPDVAYVKVTTKIPEELRKRMKIGLLTALSGKFASQDELIESAIEKLLAEAGV